MSSKLSNEIEVYVCENCGANMVFDIKSQSLKCPYCESEVAIDQSGEVKEYDFSYVSKLETQSDWNQEVEVIACESCGAETVVEKQVTALHCSYCGSSHVLKTKQSAGIKPEGVLPFKIDKYQAMDEMERWMKQRWLAPNDLKSLYQSDKLQAVYIPYWTYDVKTYSTYTGRGGRYYYETREVNGKKQTIQKVRWYPVSGQLNEFFDDVLVNASAYYSDAIMSGVEPYNTDRVQPYKTEYLSGYLAERYHLGVKEGFTIAKQKIESELENQARNEVLRRFDTVSGILVHTHYQDVTFKHVLLPIWCATYDYKGKAYQYIINGETGRIHGTYPYSWVKITILVILGAIIVYFLFLYLNS